MTDQEAFEMIKQALDQTEAGLGGKATMDSDLTGDGIIDSLDSMNFLFELETIRGKKLDAIDETFDDFRVKRLVEILQAS